MVAKFWWTVLCWWRLIWLIYSVYNCVSMAAKAPAEDPVWHWPGKSQEPFFGAQWSFFGGENVGSKGRHVVRGVKSNPSPIATWQFELSNDLCCTLEALSASTTRCQRASVVYLAHCDCTWSVLAMRLLSATFGSLRSAPWCCHHELWSVVRAPSVGPPSQKAKNLVPPATRHQWFGPVLDPPATPPWTCKGSRKTITLGWLQAFVELQNRSRFLTEKNNLPSDLCRWNLSLLQSRKTHPNSKHFSKKTNTRLQQSQQKIRTTSPCFFEPHLSYSFFVFCSVGTSQVQTLFRWENAVVSGLSCRGDGNQQILQRRAALCGQLQGVVQHRLTPGVWVVAPVVVWIQRFFVVKRKRVGMDINIMVCLMLKIDVGLFCWWFFLKWVLVGMKQRTTWVDELG